MTYSGLEKEPRLIVEKTSRSSGSRRQVTIYMSATFANLLSARFSSDTNETILTDAVRYHIGQDILPDFNPRDTSPKRSSRTRRPRLTGSSTRIGKVAISAWLPEEIVDAMLDHAKGKGRHMSAMLVDYCVNLLTQGMSHE
jgi:hypothetical protein